MLERFKKTGEQTPVVAPVVNIYEQDQKIVLAVEMPGVDKASLDIHLEGNQLTMSGRRNKEEDRRYTVLHQERVPVEYRRTFEINTDIDRDKVEAAYENGVLLVTLAKSERAQPKKIAIKTA